MKWKNEELDAQKEKELLFAIVLDVMYLLAIKIDMQVLEDSLF